MDDSVAREFVRSTWRPMQIERGKYEGRFAALQRFVHNKQLTPSPATMQLMLLETYRQNFLDGELQLTANQLMLTRTLEEAAHRLGESRSSTNGFQLTYSNVYAVFEAYAVLSLSCLKPNAPITHFACKRVIENDDLHNKIIEIEKEFEKPIAEGQSLVQVFRENTIKAASLAKEIVAFLVPRVVKKEPEQSANKEPAADRSDAAPSQQTGGGGSSSDDDDFGSAERS